MISAITGSNSVAITDDHIRPVPYVPIWNQQEVGVPLFLDIHSIVIDLTADEVAAIHRGSAEGAPGARCLRYWVSVRTGRMFCLIEADDAGLARAVHASVEGLANEECHPVSEYV